MRSWTKSRNCLSSVVVLLGACGDSAPLEDPVERVTFDKTLNAVRGGPGIESPAPSRTAWISVESNVQASVIDSRDGGMIGVTPCSFEISEPVPVCLRALGHTDHCFSVKPGVRKVFDIKMQPIAGEDAHRSEVAIDSALGEIDGIIRKIEVGKKSKRKRR